MSSNTVPDLSDRMRSMLRAVETGRAEISGEPVPDLYVDGLPCCDYWTAAALVRDGYVRPDHERDGGERVRAELTDLGRCALRGPL